MEEGALQQATPPTAAASVAAVAPRTRAFLLRTRPRSRRMPLLLPLPAVFPRSRRRSCGLVSRRSRWASCLQACRASRWAPPCPAASCSPTAPFFQTAPCCPTARWSPTVRSSRVGPAKARTPCACTRACLSRPSPAEVLPRHPCPSAPPPAAPPRSPPNCLQTQPSKPSEPPSPPQGLTTRSSNSNSNNKRAEASEVEARTPARALPTARPPTGPTGRRRTAPRLRPLGAAPRSAARRTSPRSRPARTRNFRNLRTA